MSFAARSDPHHAARQGEDDQPRSNVRGPRRVLRRQFQAQGLILLFFPMRTARHEPQGEGSRQARWTGRHFDPLVATWTKDRLRSMKLDLAAAGTLRSSIPAFDTHGLTDRRPSLRQRLFGAFCGPLVGQFSPSPTFRPATGLRDRPAAGLGPRSHPSRGGRSRCGRKAEARPLPAREGHRSTAGHRVGPRRRLEGR